MDNITGKLFSLFCSTWHTDLKMHVCEIISDLEGESKEKKFTRSYLQRRKMEKWRPKEFSWIFTKIFVAPGEHGFSFFQVKMFTGSVSVLLTSTSLKIKKKNINNNINHCPLKDNQDLQDLFPKTYQLTIIVGSIVFSSNLRTSHMYQCSCMLPFPPTHTPLTTTIMESSF